MNKLVIAVAVIGLAIGCRAGKEAKRAESAAAAPETTAAAGAVAPAAAPLTAQNRFDSAHANFLKRDSVGTAKELRAAAAILSAEADSAAPTAKSMLTASVSELTTLASSAEKGTVKSATSLEYAFARAHNAEAEHHLLTAKAAWTKKDSSTTAVELGSAIDHYQSAVRDAGVKLAPSDTLALAGDRKLVNQLSGRMAFTAADVDKSIASLDQTIRKFGRVIPKT